MLHNKFILASIFSVLLVSGCVGGGGSKTTGPNDFGVVIKSFSPDIQELESKDRFTLSMQLENNGGSDAKDVAAFLFGIPIGTGSDAFAIVSGLNPQTVAVTLRAPDESAKLPGDIADASWDLRAPDLPEGISLPYEARARLMYRYKTAATTTVSALTTAENRRLRERNEPIPSQTETVVSKGPLGVTITASAPVIIRDDTDRLRLRVNAEIIQSGSIFDPDYGGYKQGGANPGSVPQDNLDKIRVRLFAPDVTATNEECALLNADTTLSLRGGTSLSFSCELKPSAFVGRKDIPVRVELTYNFLTDASTTINVIGTRQSAPTGGTGTGSTGTPSGSGTSGEPTAPPSIPT
ncbi:MAG: hypothetical protein HY366_01675 [Candidatus Aenigmarchaeota archaeon]|nr:hypothetical protein [Candidatus Aenigmarchaeota archaeon]